ncbi:hypothetical protein A5893_10640 [Pedobacter psychrophilus]|uniref:Uncharacterized protein n=1 Tax=Pedobacter psychrophilus TaxID=1826909 RepID=A0A179DF40_9SPHI|nr:DUF5694 domain-containing protein [Pedobacter psychrophilus]OAQ39119.1 hypothetical protein A5893_10640 [Pedobacter psychrophilus]
MKTYLKIVLFAFICTNSFGQTDPKKIKIILLGTFHFNQTLDSSSKLHSNLFSPKRQSEVEDLVNNLVKQKPDKIFLEFTPKNQPFYDSIYNDYLNGKEPEKLKLKANEIFQLGMKTAKQLGHKKVYGINYQPEELQDSTYKPKNKIDEAIKNLYFAIGAFEDSARTNKEFYDLPFPYKLPKQDSLLQKSTLSNFLLSLNNEKKLMRDEYTNWNWLYSVGKENDMSTTDYVGTFWFGTNVRNYNNVLRNTDYKKDNCYLLIYGSSHIPFLKYMFKMNPFFEVVDLDEILK